MQIDRGASDVHMTEVRRQHGESRVGILPVFIDPCQTACRPGVPQIVQTGLPAIGRLEAKLARQYSERTYDGTAGTATFAFVNEEWRLRTLLHSKQRAYIAVGQQR